MNWSLCESSIVSLFFEKSDSKTYWQCATCQLIFLAPEFHPSDAEEKATYDHHENSPDHAGYVQFLSQLADPLSQKLNLGTHGLDFGCGSGPTMSHIFGKKDFTVENYDPIYSPNFELLNQAYDFVTCTEVVEHFHTPRQSFLQLDTLFTQYLGLMTQMMTPERNFADWWYHRDPTHVCFYSHETIEWIGKWLGWIISYDHKNVIIYSKKA